MFNTANSQTPVQRDQARIITGITLLLIIGLSLFALSIYPATSGGRTLFDDGTRDPLIGGALLLFYGLGVATLLLVWFRRLTLAALGVTAMWSMVVLSTGWLTGFVNPVTPGTLFVLIVVSSLVLRERGTVLGVVLTLIILTVSIMQRENLNADAAVIERGFTDWVTIGLTLVISAGLLLLFLRNTRIDRLYSLTQTTEERLKLSALTSNLSQRISRRAALDQVLNTAVEEIIQTYPFIYHAQIFLIDEKTRDARLTASTGDVGRQLLQRRHHLPVGSRSVIGQVTATGKHIIATSDSQDSVHFRNELLPDTMVEAAFPLRLGDTIIGALDLQSRDRSVLQEEDSPVFQSLADSIAIAIDNARLFEQTQQRLNENQALIEQTRAAMREVERLNQQLTRDAWARFMSVLGGRISTDIDLETNDVQKNVPLTPTLREAIQTCRVTQSLDNETCVVAVPLSIRGQSIGALEFETDEPLLPEDINLIRDICDRLALSVETTRVSDHTRRVALREAILNDLSRRLQTANNVERLLTETAQGLQSTLGAQRVAIRLGMPPRQPADEPAEKVAS